MAAIPIVTGIACTNATTAAADYAAAISVVIAVDANAADVNSSVVPVGKMKGLTSHRQFLTETCSIRQNHS